MSCLATDAGSAGGAWPRSSRMSAVRESEALVRALSWRLVLANTLAALLVMAYFTMLVELPAGRSWAVHVVTVFGGFAALDVLFCLVGNRLARARFLREHAWLDEE